MKQQGKKGRWVIGALLGCLLLAGCAAEARQSASSSTAPSGVSAVTLQLLCSAQSNEDAQRIADGYGIRLLSYEGGIALFETDEPLQTVLNRGVALDLPVLEENVEVFSANEQE